MELFKSLFKSIIENKEKHHNIYAFGIPLYSDYEYKPYINPSHTQQDLQKFHEDSFTFPGILVQREAITFYKNLGIFRGDIIALNWLKNNNGKNKTIPQYFERRYGVNFFESIDRLEINGYLINHINVEFPERIQIDISVTPKGQDLLTVQSDVLLSNNTYHNGLTNSEKMNEAKIQDSKLADESKKIFKTSYDSDKIGEELSNKKKRNDKLSDTSLLDGISNVQFQNYMNKRLLADRIAIENKDYIKSNEILWTIFESIKFTNFDRLEKNYRKLKEYDEEIRVINLHIKSIENQEWETDFDGKKIARLNERLSKATTLRNNK